MIKKAKRYFNTSGPNIPDEHYTLGRDGLIQQGIEEVMLYFLTKKKIFKIKETILIQ